MKNKKALIMGFGSIGEKHAKILKRNFGFKEIYFYSKRNSKKYKILKYLSEVKKKIFDYIVISSKTSQHFSNIKFIEKNFYKKKILIEKPLFHRNINFKVKKNIYAVGYNLRFHPLIQKLKKDINRKKIYSIKVICNSYLPDWRKNIKSHDSYSSHKKKGGGVILDLSHELDYVRWIFGNLKIKFVSKGKVSGLTHDSEDYLSLAGKIKNADFSIDLNYFSKISKRLIFVDGKNFSITLDLIKNRYYKKFNNKLIYKNINNFNSDFTYTEQHREFLQNKTKNLCSYDFAKKTLIDIEKIKRWKIKKN